MVDQQTSPRELRWAGRDMPRRAGALAVAALALLTAVAAAADSAPIPAESPTAARQRHQRVAQRREHPGVICHRGAWEHAHENTLEAFRATFELGGDGNEIDIRASRDGVLIVFHDDMLERHFPAYGEAGEYTWDQLQRLPFRDPGYFGRHCRIPTLVEVLELHRQHAGLVHLDIKRPGLDAAVAELITRMEMWDQVAHCNEENGAAILRDGRLRPRRYKAPGLFEDRSDVFPAAVAAALQAPGDDVIVDDPRCAVLALGRKLGPLSREPVSPRAPLPQSSPAAPAPEAELVGALRDAPDWHRPPVTPEERAAAARGIRRRAAAAEQLLAIRAASPAALAALEERARQRSLHPDWLEHGLDGAMSLRALLLLGAPQGVATARWALWHDDPALEPLVDPRWKSPCSWTDYRVKAVVFPALARSSSEEAAQLCRDYLKLGDEEARRIGPPQFEEAAAALLAIRPSEATALELIGHRLQSVRGRAILDCLRRSGEPWARSSLEQGAPFALAYRVER